ncbi:MAG: SDR family NAD(P)-dependent oxidoreductase [Corynebacterium sp.]|nr:SDR family NAD(P)-dependent oxidoreductase [Corynebacterium sp.]
MQTIVILGATSDIGGEIALRSASGNHIVLAARRPVTLESVRHQLEDAGAAKVSIVAFEATEPHALDAVFAVCDRIDHAVISFGILGEHSRALEDPAHALEIAQVDYSFQTTCALQLASFMQQQPGQSTITVFSSIAGYRTRRANFIYGATKAGLDAFSQGFADHLHGSTVHLCIIRPGFVIGSMTKGMRPAIMSVYPGDVAAAALEARATAVRTQRSVTRWVPRQLAMLAALTKVVPRPMWRRMPR